LKSWFSGGGCSIEAGLLLSAACLVTRRLWICMGFYMSWNDFQSAVFSGFVSGGVAEPGLFKARLEGPEFLTGGSFGMEHSAVALVYCTTVGVILLMIAIRRQGQDSGDGDSCYGGRVPGPF
jgi:hypothetical protein